MQKVNRIKRPFAIAEVCVAIIVIGISISYVFSSLRQSIQRYATLRHEIACHELADEHLAKMIAGFLTSPPEFDATVEGINVSSIERGYEIHISTKACESSKEGTSTEKETTKKASLVAIAVAVNPLGNDAICACHTTTLCVAQEGAL